MKFGIVDFTGWVLVVVMVVSVLCLIASLVWLFFLDKGEKAPCKKEEKSEKKQFFTYALLGILMYALTWVSVLLTGL